MQLGYTFSGPFPGVGTPKQTVRFPSQPRHSRNWILFEKRGSVRRRPLTPSAFPVADGPLPFPCRPFHLRPFADSAIFPDDRRWQLDEGVDDRRSAGCPYGSNVLADTVFRAIDAQLRVIYRVDRETERP